MVLEGPRGAEGRHHGVPGELLHRSAGLLDLRGHGFVEPFQPGACALGILVSGQRRGVHEIGEEHRGELAL